MRSPFRVDHSEARTAAERVLGRVSFPTLLPQKQSLPTYSTLLGISVLLRLLIAGCSNLELRRVEGSLCLQFCEEFFCSANYPGFAHFLQALVMYSDSHFCLFVGATSDQSAEGERFQTIDQAPKSRVQPL